MIAWFSTWHESEHGITCRDKARQDRAEKNKVGARLGSGQGLRLSQDQDDVRPQRIYQIAKDVTMQGHGRIRVITAQGRS